MKGLGILINALTVFVAGGIGITFRGKLKPSFQKLSLEVLGVAVILLGAYNAWDAFFVISDGQFELTGGLLVIFSLLVGPVFGSALQFDKTAIRGHDDIHIDIGGGIVSVVQVLGGFATADAHANGGDAANDGVLLQESLRHQLANRIFQGHHATGD